MKSSIVFIVIAVVLVVGAGYFIVNKNDMQGQGQQTAPSRSTLSEVIPTAKDGVVVKTETVSEAVENAEVARVGTYTTYDAKKIAESSADHIFLFFHATWCPSCRALDADIVKNIKNIPAGVEIYKIDYDTAIALKKQYGITTQHSLVEITADGTAKGSITHPATLADILKTI